MKRDKALEIVNGLPAEFDLETLIERLIFIDKVERGIEQSVQGKTKSSEEVKAMVKKW
jgi:hypothetical protein